jgi:hypothetical protein
MLTLLYFVAHTLAQHPRIVVEAKLQPLCDEPRPREFVESYGSRHNTVRLGIGRLMTSGVGMNFRRCDILATSPVS